MVIVGELQSSKAQVKASVEGKTFRCVLYNPGGHGRSGEKKNMSRVWILPEDTNAEETRP